MLKIGSFPHVMLYLKYQCNSMWLKLFFKPNEKFSLKLVHINFDAPAFLWPPPAALSLHLSCCICWITYQPPIYHMNGNVRNAPNCQVVYSVFMCQILIAGSPHLIDGCQPPVTYSIWRIFWTAGWHISSHLRLCSKTDLIGTSYY